MQVYISLGMSPSLRKEIELHCHEYEVGIQSYIRTTLWSNLKKYEKKDALDYSQIETKDVV